jgi:hypothetical protein
MGGAVFVCTLELQHDLAGAIALEPFIGDRRPGDIAAQVLQVCTLSGLLFVTSIVAGVPLARMVGQLWPFLWAQLGVLALLRSCRRSARCCRGCSATVETEFATQGWQRHVRAAQLP